MKQFIPIVVVFVFLVLGGVLFLTNNKDTTSQEASEKREIISQMRSMVDATVLTVGNPEAEATLIEYFDYKCPSCNNFHYSTGQEIAESYIDTNLLKYEIRITPVIGPDSANAARGAYCANEQGLFEQYHETLIGFMHDNYYAVGDIAAEFENVLTTSKLAEIAGGIGVDSTSFSSCVDSDKYNPNLDNNLIAAADDEVRGTPGFAIGNQSFVGGQPFSVFKTLIDIELR